MHSTGLSLMRTRKISARESTTPVPEHSSTCSQDKTTSQDSDNTSQSKNTYSEKIVIKDDQMNILLFKS